MHSLDTTDPLAHYRAKFVQSPDVAAYLDGNSLGRPLIATAPRLASFVEDQWGARLIRGWDEGWMELGQEVGDDLGRVALGAAPGQTTVGDSTTVLLYKLVRAAVAARPDRREILIDRDNFPTDRYVIEGIAAECGLSIAWIEEGDVTPDRVSVSSDTALVVLSQVAYRSGFLADVEAITEKVHEAGALMLWDLCHSVGVVPTQLDAWGVDLAVGCTYKYLNGGPGSPAFAYVAQRHHDLTQPIQGWLGSATPFQMGQGYEPAEGIRRFLSGTPPVIATLAMRDMIALIEEAGIDAIRSKSVALTQYAIDLVDELIPDATLSTPRDPARRGSHITIDHASFPALVPLLWRDGIMPDFRTPTGIRLGLSPLSTSFAEVELGIRAIALVKAFSEA
jgi:kynureninase